METLWFDTWHISSGICWKVMVFVFQDSESVVLTYYLEKDQNAEACVLLDSFTQHKWQWLRQPSVALNYCPMSLTYHFYFFLFPKLKSHLRGHYLGITNEVVHAVE